MIVLSVSWKQTSQVVLTIVKLAFEVIWDLGALPAVWSANKRVPLIGLIWATWNRHIYLVRIVILFCSYFANCMHTVCWKLYIYRIIRETLNTIKQFWQMLYLFKRNGTVLVRMVRPFREFPHQSIWYHRTSNTKNN